ncbi:uncharacterized protein [Nicotiana sylvestris]|uniref:Uncharacterized protein LOC104248156 n=1 Tax=Nicotiana sylvestris TaxID=4096 RepID=A0A1U7YEX6_NICSY|nr:PREDICTED: uncharacterized protein LOC104248156 [Nicotiana sylvestris]
MQCSEETIASLFYNFSSSFLLFLLFSYFTSILLAKFFYFLGENPFFWRNQDGYEFAEFSDDEEIEEENEYYHNNAHQSVEENNFVADIIRGAQENDQFPDFEKETEETGSITEEESIYSSVDSESIHSDDEVEVKEKIPSRDDDSDSCCYSEINQVGPTSSLLNELNTNNGLDMIDNNINNHGNCYREINKDKKVMEINLCREENIFVNASSSKLESKKLFQLQEKEEEHEIFGDSCTVGSTSKSSTEWRSSIKDSTTEDPFSSSSRRSCPKWESYTIFQKYDEEMLFFDRISAQKLHETESLRSIQACPRSISDRIVHKLSTRNKKSSDYRHHNNPFQELEAAYVAQVCLAWEALSWNYKYFQRIRASRNKESSEPGCPAYVAQQFQQFQVLLQRYVENEPYEHGRRPEIYAKMRGFAPKLLQVPEYRDSEEDKGQEDYCSRISSDSFLQIMKEAIRTFMNFLKADKENRCQILMAAFFKRNRRGSADATLLLLLKKVNKKKKSKVKDLRRSGKCMRNKRRLREEEEMEILMSLIDLKLVSRVLRMSEVNEEQLHWCEEKMNKVRLSDRKLQRDSSPLFFPAH